MELLEKILWKPDFVGTLALLGALTSEQAASLGSDISPGCGGLIPLTPALPGVFRATDSFMALVSYCLEQSGVLYKPDTPVCDPCT